ARTRAGVVVINIDVRIGNAPGIDYDFVNETSVGWSGDHNRFRGRVRFESPRGLIDVKVAKWRDVRHEDLLMAQQGAVRDGDAGEIRKESANVLRHLDPDIFV